MKFGSILPAVFGGVLAAGTAMAADLPVRPVPLPVAAFTWTGFYSGIELGGITGQFHQSRLTTDPFTALGIIAVPVGTQPIHQTRNRDSAVVGSRGGYLHQFGNFVIGIEGGTQIFNLNARRTPRSIATPFPAALTIFDPTDLAALHSGWQSSVRGRLGFAWDRFMLYGTGGVSFTTVRVDSQFSTFPNFNFGPAFQSAFVKDKSLTGWTAGVGGEWAITDAMSIGVEYRHTEYDRSNTIVGAFPFVPIFAPPIVPIRANVDFSNDAVMMTYNVRFGRIFPQFDWRL